MDLSELSTDPALSVEGTWIAYDDEGCRLKVARWGNPAFQDLLGEVLGAYDMIMEQSQLSRGKQASLVAEVMARTILKGWENLEDEGVALVYSIGEAERMLKKYPDFMDMVVKLAKKVQLFRKKAEDAAVAAAGKEDTGS